MLKQRAFDVLGNIAIVNFPRNTKQKEKRKFAERVLTSQKSIKTVLEKVGKVKGRLRKIKTKYLAGEKTKEVLYRENGCVFRFNVDTTYFSPRLSNERKEIASKIKPNEKVLVMFAGVAPFSIVIARNSKAKVFSNEINKQANKYGKMNIELNNLKNKVEMLNGDIKKVAERLIKNKEKFDVIVMPRPNLKETFLKWAFALAKKGTRIYYYGFCGCSEAEKKKLIETIKTEARKNKKTIKIINKKIAGAVAPYKVRLRIDFKVLSC